MAKHTALLLLLALLLSACSSAYYGTMEKLGYHKREIFVDRIEAAQDSQQQASEEFADALERFGAVVNFDGGDLEDLYDDLTNHLQRSEIKADQVSKRIEDVRDVSQAMFDEWQAELDQYSDPALRRRSEQTLRDTQVRYARLMRLMEAAEARIEPVLATFRDQVLFLKHNLNARAVNSLQGELNSIEADVAQLIAAMNRSIEEAQSFLDTLEPA